MLHPFFFNICTLVMVSVSFVSSYPYSGYKTNSTKKTSKGGIYLDSFHLMMGVVQISGTW